VLTTGDLFLSDAEIADICRPLKQHAARIRYLKRLGVRVERRPDGSPLVARSDWERRGQSTQNVRPANGPKWSRAA
jgi:hypothetical protein